ncbi:HD-GYP domain-containing protein [Paenibacillus sinopodophylli]|uniref:HD-GYP domain-containing protein n=1 Tax=Paenibacillus sinopodophylli TaxID=1837342 RepID=UPI00110CD095|nr:HD domain-containing phosphohydrolase [Paenibacillus sinopodophylli]
MTISPGYAEVISLQQTSAGSWMKYLMYKSPSTYRHCVRVALLAEILAPYLPINEAEGAAFIRGCFLHDVGKTRVPNDILHKKERLTDWEWSVLRKHTVYGEDILRSHDFLGEDIMQLVRYHHERYDGKGYPDGRRAEQIPLFARACAVIDALDSMLSIRPYREPISVEEAYAELARNRNTQFDASIVDIVLHVPEEEMALYFNCTHGQDK